MKIRTAALKTDLADIGLVYVKSWHDAYAQIVPAKYLQALTADKWGHILAKSDREVLVLDNDGQVVGVVTFGAARDIEYNHEAELMSLYLLPEYIHKGYGQRLLKQTETRLAQLDFATIYLWVLAANKRGRRFYQKQGFHITKNQRTVTIGGQQLVEVRYIKKL